MSDPTPTDVQALKRQLREAEEAASATIVQADLANRMLADVRAIKDRALTERNELRDALTALRLDVQRMTQSQGHLKPASELAERCVELRGEVTRLSVDVQRITKERDEALAFGKAEHELRNAVVDTRNEWEMLILNCYPPDVEPGIGYANLLDALKADRDAQVREAFMACIHASCEPCARGVEIDKDGGYRGWLHWEGKGSCACGARHLWLLLDLRERQDGKETAK
jgi:hypothetical protein